MRAPVAEPAPSFYSRPTGRFCSMSSEQPIESTENEERIRRFLAIASHDLQSPPRDIAMYAEILLDDLAGKLDGDQLKSRAWYRPHLSGQDLRRLLEAAAGRATRRPGAWPHGRARKTCARSMAASTCMLKPPTLQQFREVLDGLDSLNLQARGDSLVLYAEPSRQTPIITA